MGSSWATEKSQKRASSPWRHLFWKSWIYIICPTATVHAKQGFTVRFPPKLRPLCPGAFSGKENPNHAVSHKVVSFSMLSGPFPSCLATREGMMRRRRMWEHGSIQRSRLFVANQSANIISKMSLSAANQLLVLLSCSIAIGHSHWTLQMAVCQRWGPGFCCNFTGVSS